MFVNSREFIGHPDADQSSNNKCTSDKYARENIYQPEREASTHYRTGAGNKFY